MMDEEIIENGFWVSDEKSKDGIGVKIAPIYDDSVVKIESITIQTINHNRNDKIIDEISIYKSEFKRLIQFADLLKKETEQ